MGKHTQLNTRQVSTDHKLTRTWDKEFSKSVVAWDLTKVRVPVRTAVRVRGDRTVVMNSVIRT
jgi:hypothetical protein